MRVGEIEKARLQTAYHYRFEHVKNIRNEVRSRVLAYGDHFLALLAPTNNFAACKPPAYYKCMLSGKSICSTLKWSSNCSGILAQTFFCLWRDKGSSGTIYFSTCQMNMNERTRAQIVVSTIKKLYKPECNGYYNRCLFASQLGLFGSTLEA